MKKGRALQILCIMLVLIVTLLTSCSYHPPEGFTKEHHTYEEIVAFAKELDENAVISEEYRDTVDTAGTIEYCYREWPVVIHGIECHVTSAPDCVWNDGFLAGEFQKRYYRIDTDYDFYVLEQIVSKTQPEWELAYPEDDISARYNFNSVLSVTISCGLEEQLSDDELEVVWQEILEIQGLYEAYPIHDRIYFQLHSPGKYYDQSEDEHYVRLDSKTYATDFSEEGKRKFFEEYNQNWDLLNSGLRIEDEHKTGMP